MYKRRQTLLALAGALTLSGCSGDGDDGTDNNSGPDVDDDDLTTHATDSDSNSPSDPSPTEPTPADSAGVVGETVAGGPLTITIEEAGRAQSFHGGFSSKEAITGREFLSYDVTIEVTGESAVTVSGDFTATYLGVETETHPIEYDGAEIGGEPLISWKDDLGIGASGELYPGDTASGSVVVAVPSNDFRPADLLFIYDLDEPVRIRGGEGSPRQPYTPQSSESGTYAFGEYINHDGVKLTVTEYTLADSLTVNQDEETPGSENAQFLVITFELKNISPVRQSLIHPELHYAGSKAETGKFSLTQFEGNGESFTGLYTKRNRRDGTNTDGQQFYPGATVTGSLVYKVPREFDESNVEVIPDVQEEIVFTP